ncbi:NDR1/HIN1-like protein 1 [Gastrolobium bilobum]|uniref:NDR1/HIN1-like protein 1 n=1 Tax=Gastrolobium bilobum TaxID=150636 RepID=UPI002AAF2FA8|nr:NDR1/HIN1-like protein 1 [Gastrolobium bilobum]
MSKHRCGYEDGRRRLLRRIFAGILAFIILVLLVIFIIWITLKPTKPRFVLQDATVFAFNISSAGAAPYATAPNPNTLTVSMQVTLSSYNPNERIGIYYQNLDVYVSYRGQQISLAAELPPTYQGHGDVDVWSPLLYGSVVPVPPFMSDALQQDQTSGEVLVNVKVNGRVKWKVGTWVSGTYHIDVNCPAYIVLAVDRNNSIGGSVPGSGPAVKFPVQHSCIVDV